jgi:aquaporin Z
MNPKALAAEFIGTLWLVLGGCGSAIFAAAFLFPVDEPVTNLGIGFLGVSLAFGLTVVTGAYALGHISGGHFNPAVTLGLVAGGAFEAAKAVGYIIAQVLGGLLGAGIIYLVMSGLADWEVGDGAGAFATNGFGDDGSPGGFNLLSALVIEIVLTAIFLIVILGATAKKAAAGMGGLAIGLCLTLIHLVSIPVTNTSVNPARSIAAAVWAAIGGNSTGLEQVWLFILAPIVGGVIGGLIWTGLLNNDNDELATA